MEGPPLLFQKQPLLGSILQDLLITSGDHQLWHLERKETSLGFLIQLE